MTLKFYNTSILNPIKNNRVPKTDPFELHYL